MAEYQAIYKCRLCGKEYVHTTIGYKVAISEIPEMTCNGAGTYGTRAHSKHNCEDGSFGMADFQGFRKAE